MKESVSDILRAAVRLAVLKTGCVEEERVPPVIIEEPRSKEHGDFSTNVAMLLSNVTGVPPTRLAEAVADKLGAELGELGSVSVAGSGFVNVRLSEAYLRENLRSILSGPEGFGTFDFGAGEKVQVEFVSANPTGPLNVVSARAAAVGDSLVRLLRACGYEAQSEFYVNDSGRQVDLLGLSLQARVRELAGLGEAVIPDEGYHGEYLIDLAREIPPERVKEMLGREGEAGAGPFSRYAVERMHEAQKKELSDFGVQYDRWFRESSLHTSGSVRDTFERLNNSGYVYDKDGANWLKSSQLGDEQDRVLWKSSPEPVSAPAQPTYFLTDIAYHRNKFERGFGKVIDIWGPDHHGHVARMKAAMKAMGYPEDWLEVLIVQWVRLVRGKAQISMSKRAGEFVTLSDLVREVGRDCVRFFFLMRRVSSHLDFDLDLAKKQSDENPVYYVQYAHARASNIIEFAREGGVGLCGLEQADLSLLKENEEIALLREMVKFPETVRAACLGREPQRVTGYLTCLATALHQFYHNHRVVGVDPALMQARLVLVRGVKTLLKNGLELIGVSAPDKM
ncbi:MAG: arginine--tRNA ligase [Candidatus Eisenbacteria bacterium]